MIYFLLFILELGFLFFISKKLINSLARIIFKTFKTHSAVVHTLAILFLPGTIIHELSHLLIAGMMLIPVGELSVLPEVEERGIKLGSVQIGSSDPLRRTIVGVAPVLVGTASILGILYFLQLGNSFVWWQILISLYLTFEIGNTMFSSKKDLEGVIGFLVAILIVGILILGGLYFLNPNLFQNLLIFLSNINLITVINFFKLVSLYLVVPIILDLVLIFLIKLT